MTTNLIDIQNSDVIMATSNMAENHPVGFQWVMKAKERGAKLIHVDPRFTRTSAAADVHVPLRSGTNIMFFGGLINYAIQNNLYFKDYVVHYTNASFLIDPAFKTATDLSGLFTGYDPAKRTYDQSSWRYQLDAEGNPKRDLTLRDSNSVFQLLRRHYSRYTPEMVERVCGIPKEKFVEVAKLFCGTSGPEKTGSITYALNLTQHTNGVENIRALCMLQLLLGNIGRPGGGVVALRGHANVQGATDLAVLYQDLPGYHPMPLRDAHPDLKTYLEKTTPKSGFVVNRPKWVISMLKAWYGDKATKENDFGYDFLAKRASADAYSHQHIFVDMYKGRIKGFFAIGQNPAVGGPNAKLARAALGKLDWLVVQDIFLTETAEFWKAPASPPHREAAKTNEIKTEVFFLPAAPAAEKDGSLTNTMRLIQWHEKAVDPPGDVRSDAEILYELGKRLKKLYAGSKAKRNQGILAMTWEYGDKHPDMVQVLKEMNGYAVQELTDKEGKVLYKKGEPLKTFADLRDDGSTASGIWIYTGVIVNDAEGKLVNRAALRKPADEKDYLAHNWGFAWPANRRIIYNRASADPSGKPWSERKKFLWWDPEAPSNVPDKKGRWVGMDVPDFNAFLAPDAKGGDNPYIMRPDGKGAFFGPLVDGPFPEHYEPIESPVKNLLSRQQNNPTAKIWDVGEMNRLAEVGSGEYPYVITTYRLTEHHLSGVMSRYLPMLAELFESHFAEISHELAEELGIKNGDTVTVASPRGKIHAKAMVTSRLKPFIINGKKTHQIGVPWHWGYNGIAKGDITNDLSATVGDPNVFIQETKAFLCNVKKGVV